MRSRICDVALVLIFAASCLTAPRIARGDETTLGKPELLTSDAEAIAARFHLQQTLEARRDQIAETIVQKRRHKIAALKESAASLGTRPEFADNASSLKHDEFETKAEWENRVAKARELEKKQVEASQHSWDSRKRQLASKEQSQLQDIDREITRLTGDLSGIETQVKKTRDEGARDSWLIWLQCSPLARYDLNKGVFPNLSCAASTVASPANRVLLMHGNLGGKQTALFADLTAVNGKKSYEIHASSRDVAKTFKQDWADGKVFVASTCQCTPRSIQPTSEVVLSEAITREGPERSAPDYGSAAFNLIGGILNITMDVNDPEVSRYAGGGFADALNRKQRDVIVVQERKTFTADLIAVDVIVGPPTLFHKVGNDKVQTYEGVEVR